MESRTIDNAQCFVRQFVEQRNWRTPPSDVLIHLVEEIGEVARNVLILKNYGGQHVEGAKKMNIDEELADVLYLLLKLANECNVDLSSAFESKMVKNAQRFPADAQNVASLRSFS